MENKEYKGGGFIAKPLHEKSWLFMGGKMGAYPIINTTDNYDYFPTDEAQQTNYIDPWTCVFQSALHELAKLIGWKSKTDSDIMPIMTELGCIDGFGKINFSVRFSAWMAGMRRSGVGIDYETALNSIRKYGVLGDKFLPSTPDLTENTFWVEPTDEMKAQALKFKEWFDFNYETVVRDFLKSYGTYEQIKEAHKRGTIIGCVDGNYEYMENGLIGQGRVLKYNHSIGYDEARYKITDSYPEFKKTLIPDYKIGYPTVLYCVKKKPMTPYLVKEADLPNVYLHIPIVGMWFGVSSTTINGIFVEGGEWYKAFVGGDYKNAHIKIAGKDGIPEIDKTKIGEIKPRLIS